MKTGESTVGNMSIKIMLDDGAFAPERAHEDDAGYDLRTPEAFTIAGLDDITIDTGVHIQIPKGYVGMIKSKSGLNVNCCITTEGVIDSGYTGSIRVKLYNKSLNYYNFNRGDKIAQLVILPIITPKIKIVDKLDETERGSNGFGSTGR